MTIKKRFFMTALLFSAVITLQTPAKQYDISQPLPQIADLENIKIYGVKSSGVVVCFEKESKFFNWNWQNSIHECPSVVLYQKDGKKELRVVSELYQGPGTSSQELHILNINPECYETFEQCNSFSESDLTAAIEKKLNYHFINHQLYLQLNGQSKTIAMEKQIDHIFMMYPEFEIEKDNITFSIHIGVFYHNSVMPDIPDLIISGSIQNDGQNNYQICDIHFEQK